MTTALSLSLLASMPPSDFELELLIPIVAIVGGISIPIFAIYFQHRKRQLQASIIEKAIEQGLSTEEIGDLLEQHGMEGESVPKAAKKNVPFRSGLILFAVGAAFFLSQNPQLINANYPASGLLGGSGNFISFLLMGIGAAHLLSDILNFNQPKDRD